MDSRRERRSQYSRGLSRGRPYSRGVMPPLPTHAPPPPAPPPPPLQPSSPPGVSLLPPHTPPLPAPPPPSLPPSSPPGAEGNVGHDTRLAALGGSLLLLLPTMLLLAPSQGHRPLAPAPPCSICGPLAVPPRGICGPSAPAPPRGICGPPAAVPPRCICGPLAAGAPRGICGPAAGAPSRCAKGRAPAQPVERLKDTRMPWWTADHSPPDGARVRVI